MSPRIAESGPHILTRNAGKASCSSGDWILHGNRKGLIRSQVWIWIIRCRDHFWDCATELSRSSPKRRIHLKIFISLWKNMISIKFFYKTALIYLNNIYDRQDCMSGGHIWYQNTVMSQIQKRLYVWIPQWLDTAEKVTTSCNDTSITLNTYYIIYHIYNIIQYTQCQNRLQCNTSNITGMIISRKVRSGDRLVWAPVFTNDPTCLVEER